MSKFNFNFIIDQDNPEEFLDKKIEELINKKLASNECGAQQIILEVLDTPLNWFRFLRHIKSESIQKDFGKELFSTIQNINKSVQAFNLPLSELSPHLRRLLSYTEHECRHIELPVLVTLSNNLWSSPELYRGDQIAHMRYGLKRASSIANIRLEKSFNKQVTGFINHIRDFGSGDGNLYDHNATAHWYVRYSRSRPERIILAEFWPMLTLNFNGSWWDKNTQLSRYGDNEKFVKDKWETIDALLHYLKINHPDINTIELYFDCIRPSELSDFIRSNSAICKSANFLYDDTTALCQLNVKIYLPDIENGTASITS